MTARVFLWPTFFISILLAWVALWAMGQEVRGFRVYGAEFWVALCQSGVSDLAYAPLVAMWAIMTAAMMAPTFVPALNTFVSLPPPAGRTSEALMLALGYMCVWFAAAFGFAAFQLGLSYVGLVAPDGRSLSDSLTALLCLTAGLYQFSRFKSACLSRCRAPLTFFMQHWRAGRSPAFIMGARIGADCLGCCWALMLLAFVGGMANLLWMGLATVIMVLEKLPEIGRPLTRPLGWVLLSASAIYSLRAMGGL